MSDEPNSTLGMIGEQAFALWAAQAGFTPTKITYDRHGWDYVIHANPGASSRRLHLDPPVLTCLVQVKATRKSEGQVDVSLSNLQRLATSPMPAFLLVTVVGEHDEPEVVRVVHVDSSWIARIAKRLCELSAEERAAIHKKTLRVAWSSAGVGLAAPFGKALLAHVSSVVDVDAHQYAQNKAKVCREVGFEGHRIDFVGREVMPPETFDALAEFAVGTRLDLSVPMAISEVRFGFSEELPDSRAAKSTTISFAQQPKGQPILLSLRTVDGTDRVSLDAELKVASDVFSFLPPDHDLWSFVATGLRLTVRAPMGEDDPRVEISLNIPPDDGQTPLRDVARAIKAFRLLTGERPCELTVGFANQDPEKATVLQMKRHPAKMPHADYPRAIEDADALARLFGLPELMLTDARALQHHAQSLRCIALLQEPLDEPLTMTATMLRGRSDESWDPQAVGDVAMVAVFHALLAERVVAQFVAVRGRPEVTVEGDEVRVSIKSRFPVLLARRLFPRQTSLDVLLAIADAEARRLEADGVRLVLRPGRAETDVAQSAKTVEDASTPSA